MKIWVQNNKEIGYYFIEKKGEEMAIIKIEELENVSRTLKWNV